MKTPLLRIGATALTLLTFASACGYDADTSAGAAPTTTVTTTVPGSGDTATMFSLTGTITLNGADVAIPAGAKVVVSIQDVSLQDGASVTIIERVYEDITSFPFGYELSWDDALAPGNTYSVSASITLDDELLFVTDTAFDVTVEDTVMDFFVISVDGDTSDTNANADSVIAAVIGLSEDDAVAQISAAGFSPRIVERNGEMFAGTMDYREDRINLTIADDLVTVAQIG